MELKPRAEWRESAWLTASELADVLDVSVELVRREVSRRVPNSCKRRRGRSQEFYAPAAVQAWMEPRVRRAIQSECKFPDRAALDLLEF